MSEYDLEKILDFYSLTLENWEDLPEETRMILKQKLLEKTKVYERIDLKDGFCLLGKDVNSIRFVGIYPDDNRPTIFIAEDDYNPLYPSYMEIVERLRGPTPYTEGLASSQGMWGYEDVKNYAEHLQRIENELDSIWIDPMKQKTTKMLEDNVIETSSDLDDLYTPLIERMRNLHSADFE
jgi:hypothetical protein